MKKNISIDKEVIQWLSARENPSVRYFTLRDVLGRSGKDPDVQAAHASIPASEVITKIFSKQADEGYWEEPWNPYHPKYKSSYWTIMTLGQLGIDRRDMRVKKACDYIFRFQEEEGGFSSATRTTALREYSWHLKKGKKLPPRYKWVLSLIHEGQLSCLTGNMAAALMRLGYHNDTRVRKALAWLMKIQNDDGGWLCPYWPAHVRDKHGCFYGTVCPLEAFSEVLLQHRTAKMKKVIERGAEFLLMHHLFKADHHNYQVINKSWLHLGFPWFYGYNILRGLDVLTKLGYIDDARLDDAVAVVMQKRRHDGKWILEAAPTSRMHVNLEAKGKPSKWITLIALRVLKRMHE